MQSPDNDLLLCAAARARWKALFLQKLPVYLMMAPAVGFYLATKSYTVLIILMYIVPWFYIPLVGLISSPIVARYGSYDIHFRQEISRLRQVAYAAAGQVSVTVDASKTDIAQRVSERRLSQFWKVSKLPRQVRRPMHAHRAMSSPQRRSSF